MKNHTMPDLPCPVCGTLCRADVVLRHKQAISDNAQRPVTPVTDAMVEAGARVMAARRGIKNSDELITTTNSGKVPAWQFYIEEPRAILEAALSTLPSTGLPAPAPHAGVRESELAEWKQAASVEAGLRRGFLEQVEAAREFVKRHPALSLIDLAEFEVFIKIPAAIDAALPQQDRGGK